MNKQPTRRRRASRAAARTLAVGVTMAALVATVGASQAMAGTDERVLERQGMIDRQTAASQADQQGNAGQPSQGSPTQPSRRFIRPEPRMYSQPQLGGDEQVAPAPAPTAPDAGRPVLAITMAVAALLLALAAGATWRIRHRRPRPRPEPTT
jgi:hypothetical protein